MATLDDLAKIDYRKIATEAMLKVYQRHAVENAPKDTGELSESSEVDVESGTLAFTADHAVYVEFGTSNMEAQSFLRRTVDNDSTEAQEAAVRAIETAQRQAL